MTNPNEAEKLKDSNYATIINKKKLYKTFNSLFDANSNITEKSDNNVTGIDKETGLLGTNALNYSLQTYLHLGDDRWVLAMLDIDNLKHLNDTLGYSGTNARIKFVGQIIKDFCDSNPLKFQGFRNNDGSFGGKGDLFAILIYCKRNLQFAERHMKSLIKQINNISNTQVSVGIAKMNKNKNKNNKTAVESFEQWKHRAFNNILKVKNNINSENHIYSDINEILEDAHDSKDDSKDNNNSNSDTNDKKNNTIKVIGSLGDKQSFDEKMKEMVMNEDNKWILGIIDADNMGDFKDEKGKVFANNEIIKIGNEILKMSNILGKEYCLGYKLSGGDEFGIIIHESDNSILPGKDIIQTLIDNVSFNSQVTISVGFSKLDIDNEEMTHEWYQRTNEYLSQAKKNGKNQCYFGQDMSVFGMTRTKSMMGDEFDIMNQITENENNTMEDDQITLHSLQSIEVSLCLISNSGLCFLCCSLGVFFYYY